MQGTAVLTAVSAGRGRPKRPKLCALVAFNYVVSSWHATRLIFRTPPPTWFAHISLSTIDAEKDN
jgi:hypothetical protein